MSQILDIKNHITHDPQVMGGKPCIAGTRIRVWDIYELHERRGYSPDEIVSAFPHITLSDVHAALAYFWDNQDEIRAQMKQSDDVADEIRKSLPPSRLDAYRRD